MKIRCIFMTCWVLFVSFLTGYARKNRKNSFFIKILEKCYRGYDPFLAQGILTGLLYAVFDGYLTGWIIEILYNRYRNRKKLP